jgi:microcompartment protein CcmK/EutM
MIIAKVIKRVVSTQKHPILTGETLLVVEPIPQKSGKRERPIIALSRVQAGPGDLVLVTKEGDAIKNLLGAKAGVPLNAAIVGIIDHVWENGQEKHF